MKNETLATKLYRRFDTPIRDPLWNHIYLDEAFTAITRTEPFDNLTKIRQLGPSFRVYPGAVHTRASHSLGVFEIGKRILMRLLRDPFCPALSEIGALSFLTACLLHDTGHFPFTHSLKELPLKEHEQISAEIILEEPLRSKIKAAGADPEFCAAVIDDSISTEESEILFYRNILSGTLDPDKLDYLNRDAYFCGVPYGVQDIDRVLDRMTADDLNGIGLYEDGILSVENILFSKYSMYQSVYWHKTVRNATAMIKKGVAAALNRGLLKPQSLYRQNDVSFFALLTDSRFPLHRFFSDADKGRFYLCVAEKQFSEFSGQQLTELEARARFEAETAAALGVPETETDLPVILDIPEPIRFETQIKLFNKNHEASAGNPSIFDGNGSRRFSDCLRRVRLFVRPDISRLIGSGEWQSFLN